MQILLRPWQQKDAEPLVALANNKKIWDNMRDYFPHPYTSKDAKECIAFSLLLILGTGDKKTNDKKSTSPSLSIFHQRGIYEY